MNKWMKKLTAVGLCAVLCLGGVGVAFVQTEKKTEEVKQKEESTKDDKKEQTVKDETVYVLSGADGSVQKIIVSDWMQDALGEDSYSQETMEKELPVSQNISYQLDGKAISAENLAGKSGRVSIRFSYENHQYDMVEVNGQTEKIFVPFAVLTGMMLDNSVFHNVEVHNGKLLNDGERTIVAGIAFPGMQENLAISKDKIEIPEYVEITADVTDFEFGMTLTVASNEIFSKLDTEKFSDADEITDSLSMLTDAMEELMDGSSALYDGLNTLQEKSGTLLSGVTELTSGAGELKKGIDTVDDGAGELQAKTQELSAGLAGISANSADLNSGAKQVFDTLLATAQSQIQAAGVTIPTLTVENYAAVLTQVVAGLEQANETGAAQTIRNLKASLDSYATFYQGLQSYTAGVDTAAAGANKLAAGTKELKSGTAQVKTGAQTLYDGTVTMKNSVPALVDGITKLRDGSVQLADGLKQFNEEGVQKLADIMENDVDGALERLKATIEVSGNYRNFSGISQKTDGQVKFIYRTAEIVSK